MSRRDQGGTVRKRTGKEFIAAKEASGESEVQLWGLRPTNVIKTSVTDLNALSQVKNFDGEHYLGTDALPRDVRKCIT